MQLWQPSGCDVQPRPVSQLLNVVLSGHVTPGSKHADTFGLHVTSHAHEPLQSKPRHALNPVHVAVHLPAPQLTGSQVREPLHVKLHDFASEQSIPLRHSSLTVHLMMQFQPAGQVTACEQSAPAAAQSIVHIMLGTSHVVQALGHRFASGCGWPSGMRASISPPGNTQ